MATWQSLSKQAEQLSWRDRLVLTWQLVRSLLGRSSSTESSPIAGVPNSLAEAEKHQSPISGIPGQHLVKFAGLIPAEDLQDISEAITTDCRRVTGRYLTLPDFWERLQQWRSTIDWDSWSDDDPWADVRDHNPGRNVTL